MVQAMGTRDELHALLDRISDQELELLRQVLQAVLAGDQVTLRLLAAPTERRQLRPEAMASLESALEAARCGDLIADEDLFPS
jgi:hypothetical protein